MKTSAEAPSVTNAIVTDGNTPNEKNLKKLMDFIIAHDGEVDVLQKRRFRQPVMNLFFENDNDMPRLVSEREMRELEEMAEPEYKAHNDHRNHFEKKEKGNSSFARYAQGYVVIRLTCDGQSFIGRSICGLYDAYNSNTGLTRALINALDKASDAVGSLNTKVGIAWKEHHEKRKAKADVQSCINVAKDIEKMYSPEEITRIASYLNGKQTEAHGFV